MRPPIGAAWSGSAVPATRPTRGPATARRYSPTISHPSTPSAANSLPPFAMWPAFPASDYYGGSATSRPAEPTTNRPAADLEGRPTGPARDASHVHHTPVDGVGAQLCPCGIATSTPQTFLVASLPATSPRHRSHPPDHHRDRIGVGVHRSPARIRQVGAGVS